MTPATNRSAEFVLGLLIAVVPALLNVTQIFEVAPAGIVVTALAGIALMGAGISVRRDSSGDGSLAPTGQAVIGRIIGGALIVAGIVFLLADEREAAVVCLIGGAAELVLTLATRYPRADGAATRR